MLIVPQADEAYLCFDTTESDLKAISIYTFDGDWIELKDITEKNNLICGKVTSSPYMIAGFKTSASQQSALNSINILQDKILRSLGDTTRAEELLQQARDAYYNCEYQDAYDLSQEALIWIPFLILEGIKIPIMYQLGAPGALLEVSGILLFNQIFGYEVIYLDILPIIEIMSPGRLWTGSIR